MATGANMCTKHGGKILKFVNKPLKKICRNSGYQFKYATISILLQICKITVNHKMLVYILYWHNNISKDSLKEKIIVMSTNKKLKSQEWWVDLIQCLKEVYITWKI